MLGEEFGPVTTDALRELVAQGSLGAADEVSPDDGDWRAVSACPELNESGGDDDTPALDDDLASMLDHIDSGPSGTTRAPTEQRHVWYARIVGEELGPFDWDDLSEMAAHGELAADDEVKRGQEGQWQSASEIVGLISEGDESPSADDSLASATPQRRWQVEVGVGQVKSASFEKLQRLAAEGRITPRDRIRQEGTTVWLRASTQPGLFADLEQSRSVARQAEETGKAVAKQQAEQAPAAVRAEADTENSEAAEKTVTPEETAPSPTPPDTTPSAPTAEESEEPEDKWSSFFDRVEERERKKWKRDKLPPAPKPTPPKPEQSAVSPGGPAASSMGSAQSSTPSPAAVSTSPPTPASVAQPPAFATASKPKRSMSLPSFDFSGLLDRFQGGGEGASTKILVFLGVVVVIAAIKFVPTSFGGDPGAADYPALAAIWQKVLQLKETEADASAWSALKAEAEPVIDDMQARLAPDVDSKGKDVPIAQRVLWMVDKDSGPTGAPGYLRKILDAGAAGDENDFNNAQSAMAEAGSLMPK